jgi:excinuclease ABC subunit A
VSLPTAARPESRPEARARPECIRLKGVRQNNLKGFDLDLPLGRYIVVTGLSGAGKSSLVFDTLHAEGQRRYVETFSAYTRQFLELLGKPDVAAIENIRPSIAIEQTNTVKTSRSTVGTMTELTDFFKVWFAQSARLHDPATGAPIRDGHPAAIWEQVAADLVGRTVLVVFPVRRPGKLTWREVLSSLLGQSYQRVIASAPGADFPVVTRIEDQLADASPLEGRDAIDVVQDRLRIHPEARTRFAEAVETALHFGDGELRVLDADSRAELGRFARGLRSPVTGRRFRAASPALFSFNSPLGACPRCRGFGRIIEVDYRLAIPDASKSIREGAIRCWEGEVYGESKKDLLRFARTEGIPVDVPFAELSPTHRSLVIDGEPGYGTEGREWPQAWYGIRGFFRWLEKSTYKMHVRVFLSRYRAYNPCPDCAGTRLQPESLCWQWQGRTLPQLYQLPVDELLPLLTADAAEVGDRSAVSAREAIVTRLRYLQQVGLGYLSLDRPSKTLSGGEVQRVNLTSCLGTSLVDTLFVLDEPSVGLHARDVDRLIAIVRRLTQAGNTVVVVEHDEAMIRAADHIIEIGPEPGARGGHVVFSGPLAELARDRASLTGDYLFGRRRLPTPERRRPINAGTPRLSLRGVTKHNLRGIDVAVPLGRLVCLSGVSGSGKSTLLDHALFQGLQSLRHQLTDDAAVIASIEAPTDFSEVVFVDQSPLSRTPRSNPALYTEAWDTIRDLYAATPEARERGLSASSFSFNAGDGRCEHCLGLGYERVEMQFLSDVFVPCPTCDGRRFRPEVLAIAWRGRSVADLLASSVADALPLFDGVPAVQRRLEALASVGLGYLSLGQPLNTLSGGEAQRLKLIRYLSPVGGAGEGPALLLLDEPTTGLHRHDVARLLTVLHQIVDRGHSLVLIEHNLDVLRSADWIIELGPEAGRNGGSVVAQGTPEAVAEQDTATSPFLREALRADASSAGSGPKSPCQAVAASPLTSARATSAAAPVNPLPAATDSHVQAIGPDTRHEPGVLRIRGAREHNLRDLSLDIPQRRLVVVTGVSGSGKSTLAFDIVFAEGQRRFMESMSPYARQFVEQLPRPEVDRVEGIPPTVAIEQRVTRGSRKSTVATITEVAQYLRLLFARAGVQHHPDTGRAVAPLSLAQLRLLLARVLRSAPARRAAHLYLCAPLVRGRKGHHQPIATWIAAHGYELMRVDGQLQPVSAFAKLDRYREHDIEVVVADLRRGGTRKAGAEPLAEALRLGKGACFLLTPRGEVLSWFSTTRTDRETGESFPELDPKHFSHNSPRGWCPSCRGHGRIFPWMIEAEPDGGDEAEEAARRLREFGLEAPEDVGEEGSPCPDCGGARLNRISRAVRLPLRGGALRSLPELLAETPAGLLKGLTRLKLDARGQLVLKDILPPVRERLRFLDEVGLGYLTLDRPTDTLSGGEAQRIRLAAQLGTNLAGVLYVLDEPSIGLHARDNQRLIATLERLRDKGNSVLVVEHDDELMSRADHLIDLGPGAGIHGGRLLAEGAPAAVCASPDSITGRLLRQGITHPTRGAYRAPPPTRGRSHWLSLTGVAARNLAGFDLALPLGRLVVVIGPSGAGKSTLVHEVIGRGVSRARTEGVDQIRGAARTSGSASGERSFRELRGAGTFRSVVEVDQSPIGKTPRSTPATYLGIFDLIRTFFATLPESKVHGYTASRFSFNTAGGRCPTCEGAGRIRLEMAFMPETYLPCEDCRGLRYGPDVAEIRWKGRNIGEVLQMSFEEAVGFFDFHATLSGVCRLMVDCGLGYLALGQSSPTLSGGEAQRLKLVSELAAGLPGARDRARNTPVRNLYLLEEPTIGLHLSDCQRLIGVLHALVEQGHTVIVIEHHLDVIAEADWVVELGPDGGPRGGRLLYSGPLEPLLTRRSSPTAPHLTRHLRRVRTAE